MKRNHKGYRVGQDHHRAKLTDAQVAAMRVLRKTKGATYRQLAAQFKCSMWTARDIVDYRTRA